MAKRYLQLASGEVFAGEAFGASGETIGELVFSTGMVGYIEALSDPRYHGQILLQTYPLIGNYGMIAEDMVSDRMHPRAYVVRELCDAPSNYRCAGALDAVLREQGVIGISGIDTRALTTILREKGTMPARITDQMPTAPDNGLCSYRAEGVISAVAPNDVRTYPATGEEKCRAALIDCGCGASLAARLVQRGIAVTAYSPTVSADTVSADAPDLLIVSDGPGDPKDPDTSPVIALLRELLGKLPTFGVGLGHQLMALSLSADTYRLKAGHRGANQPVKSLADGKIAITAQNQGFAVDAATLPDGAVCTHINVNDGSCAGVAYPALRACSIQYDPTAADLDGVISMTEEAANYAL
ncbi:MAG: glutamine-hydrolyzing carbamoyl-phosphate synthase small subunit [Clostridia bacterium]|nr:glutamine-hydrolyzing carbamoyl-phosphate synthase small subunit [Clostridia bacterium]